MATKKSQPKSAIDSISEEMAEMPKFSLSANALPAMKDWKVGKTYTVSVKLKMTANGLGKTPYGIESDKEESKEQYGTFRIVSIEDESNEDESAESGYDAAKPMSPINHPMNGSKGGGKKK